MANFIHELWSIYIDIHVTNHRGRVNLTINPFNWKQHPWVYREPGSQMCGIGPFVFHCFTTKWFSGEE